MIALRKHPPWISQEERGDEIIAGTIVAAGLPSSLSVRRPASKRLLCH